MTIKDPAHAGELLTLAGTREAATGLKWPEQISSWYDEFLAQYWHLTRSIAPIGFRVEREATAGSVQVLSGRASIRGHLIDYTTGNALNGTVNGVIDLSGYAGDTAYIALLYDVAGGHFEIAVDTDANGWPSGPHIKLAEVTVSAGPVIAYDAIVDRRGDQLITNLVGELVHYDLTLTTQGDTGSPSRVQAQLDDLQGNAVAEADFLRVRVCDDGAYGDATNATIAAAGSTTVAETVTSSKDLVFKSSGAGLFEIDLTNATAETVTLRLGPAPLGSRRADYSPTLDVAHAAP